MTNSLKNKKILVIEDDQGISELIKITLEDSGFEVVVSMDGKNVRQIIAEEKPALILLDLWIPGLNSEAITKKLKSEKDTSQIPIIIVSAQNNLPDVIRTIGADDFLAKPFDLENLLNITKRYVSGI